MPAVTALLCTQDIVAWVPPLENGNPRCGKKPDVLGPTVEHGFARLALISGIRGPSFSRFWRGPKIRV